MLNCRFSPAVVRLEADPAYAGSAPTARRPPSQNVILDIFVTLCLEGEQRQAGTRLGAPTAIPFAARTLNNSHGHPGIGPLPPFGGAMRGLGVEAPCWLDRCLG